MPPDDLKSRIDSLFEELRQHYQVEHECEEVRQRILQLMRSVACHEPLAADASAPAPAPAAADDDA